MEAEMRTGTVAGTTLKRAGGSFALTWRPKDLFVHISDLRDCAGSDLVSGTRVTFEIRFNKHRPKYRAVQVRLID
ncbi:hypothetical protein XI05_11885 [Bradyrhizobium sp. CCBAU 11357]|nr:hypothetical protein [Bradyrhizobium sp. CCBAU 11357]